jgi:hypothetical protein
VSGARAQFGKAPHAAAVHQHPLALLLPAAFPFHRVRIGLGLAVHGFMPTTAPGAHPPALPP